MSDTRVNVDTAKMRATLRRSCNSCAKAKQGCDLRLPQCSRCIKKKSTCIYANEPMASGQKRRALPVRTAATNNNDTNIKRELVSSAINDEGGALGATEKSVKLSRVADASFDPFDSYPPTRLPRARVQRLIHDFLSNIAFTYYPLDLNMGSNPFIVEWWPRALADPALFHVSLQTASLNEERRAQKGFPISEILMVDSLSLLRRRLEDPTLAFQDETLDSVVTLAAIEHGKRNVETSRAHINAIKEIVNARGGINELKRTSPLTARMISWVSLLVTETPQFDIQDGSDLGTGIVPTPQWQSALTGSNSHLVPLDCIEMNSTLSDILIRLRHIFHFERLSSMSNVDFHDLICFVLHKLLLLSPSSPENSRHSAISECFRHALTLFMLFIHGTAFYSHDDLAHTMVLRLKNLLEPLLLTNCLHNSAGLWIVTVALAATFGTPDRKWFVSQACTIAMILGLQTWEDVLVRLDTVFWMRSQQEKVVQDKWEQILTALND